jgi:DNA-binding transcriptional regulator YhcF (GntR family)
MKRVKKVMGETDGTPSQQFRRWLASKLENRRPDHMLPSDRQLARGWRLSQSTVRRIMRDLARNGKLVRIRGKGTFVRVPGDTESEHGNMPLRLSTAQSVAEHLAGMIMRGAIRHGERLPPQKAIALQYGVSPASVIAAYRHLCSQGYAHHVGRGYWAGRQLELGFERRRLDVVFYYGSVEQLERMQEQPRLNATIVKMERELARHGIVIRYAHCGSFEQDARTWLHTGKSPVGIALYDDDHHSGVTQEMVDGLAPPIGRLKRRFGMSVLVVSYRYVCPFGGMHCALLRGHTSTMVSRVLASYIVGRGHRRATLFYDTGTQGRRSMRSHLKLYTELTNLRDDFGLELIVKSRSDSSELMQIETGYASRSSTDHLTDGLSKYRATSVEQVMKSVRITADFSSMFHRALDAPVWVFAGDSDAVDALHWLEERGKRVPHDIELISLENGLQCRRYGITSCVVDWEGLGYLMAHALIGDIPIATTRRGLVWTDAVVVERRSRDIRHVLRGA